MRKIMQLFYILIMQFMIVTSFVGCTNVDSGSNRQTNINTGLQNESLAYAPISSLDYDGLKCVDVATMFYNAGFKNITTTIVEQIISESRYGNGDVYLVRVGDKVNFQLNDEFDPYTKVEIRYITLVDSYGSSNNEPIQINQIIENVNDDKGNTQLSGTDSNIVNVQLSDRDSSKSNTSVNNASELKNNDASTDATLNSEDNNKLVSESETYSDVLEVHYIDVGQGDCTLIKCGTHAMLIDAGPDSKGTAIQLYLNKQNVTSLDYVLLTHYDEDHAGGADVILTKYNCDKVILPSYVQDNKSYRDVMDTMIYRNYSSTEARTGDTYTIGAASFKILSVGNSGDSNNNQSICIRVDYGSDSFLFTGDADESVEAKLMNSGQDIDVDVFQVGHHGSKDSNSSKFISKISPKYAVISCGADNTYGHPTAETLNNLRTSNVEVFRTDEQGTVIASTKGNGITWNTQPSTTWKAGEANGGSVSESSNSNGSVSNNVTENKVSQETSDNVNAKNDNNVSTVDATNANYIGNTNNGKLHKATCKTLPKEYNRVYFATKEEAVNAGYSDPCGNCKP